MISLATKSGGNAGTLVYQHQEQLRGKPPTPSVDVYSFGVIALEVYTRVRAWRGLSSRKIREKILNGEFPDIPRDKVPEEAQALIGQCFQGATERPSMTDLLPLLQKLVHQAIDIW